MIVAAFSWFNVSFNDGVGSKVYNLSTASALKPSYDLGVGNLRLDLSHIGPITTVTHLKAKVDVGELRIIVPRNTAISVNAHAKVGDVYVFNQHEGGRNIDVQQGSGGQLVIDATVGAGRIDVVRANG